MPPRTSWSGPSHAGGQEEDRERHAPQTPSLSLDGIHQRCGGGRVGPLDEAFSRPAEWAPLSRGVAVGQPSRPGSSCPRRLRLAGRESASCHVPRPAMGALVPCGGPSGWAWRPRLVPRGLDQPDDARSNGSRQRRPELDQPGQFGVGFAVARPAGRPAAPGNPRKFLLLHHFRGASQRAANPPHRGACP